MRKKNWLYVIFLIAGIGSLGAGFCLQAEEVKRISGMFIGIGAGLFGMSISGLLMKRLEQEHPELDKQAEIEYKDERNIIIRNRAKAKAGDMTQWLMMGIAYFTIAISAPLWITLAVIAAFLFYHAAGVYLMNKYQKEM